MAKKEKLKDYLERRGENQRDFAKRAGMPQSTVSRLCRGRDACGRRWAQIEAATRGRVKASHHYPVGKR